MLSKVAALPYVEFIIIIMLLALPSPGSTPHFDTFFDTVLLWTFYFTS